MTTVHLFVGLPGSGKTTFSKSVAQKRGGVRFTLDEWMKGLCDYSIDTVEYGELAERVKERIWQTALSLLERDVDVILDWSLWSKVSRKAWTSRIQKAGYAYRLYYFDTPIEVIEDRLAERNRVPSSHHHQISIDEVVRFGEFFEVPDGDEGLSFETIRT